jgi:predicted DNA-binding protein (MmcQ/YjbR family)
VVPGVSRRERGVPVRRGRVGLQGGRKDVRAQQARGTATEGELECEPELASQLRASYAAIEPGYHLNKRHWNTITLDGSMPDRLVRDMIEDSYDLVVAGLPRTARERVAGPRR